MVEVKALVTVEFDTATEVTVFPLEDPAKYPIPAPARTATISNPARALPLIEVVPMKSERDIRLAARTAQRSWWGRTCWKGYTGAVGSPPMKAVGLMTGM
jgi:hypothetical protein